MAPRRPARVSLSPLGGLARQALGELRAEGLSEEAARAWVFAILGPSTLRACGRDVPEDPLEAAFGWQVGGHEDLPASRRGALTRALGAASLPQGPDASTVLLRAHEEALAGSEARGRAGAFYTPASIVEGLLGLVMPPLLEGREPEALLELRVCDPACGGGVFLLGLSDRLGQVLAQRTGLPAERCRSELAKRVLFGVDLDPVALSLARGLVWGCTDLPWEGLGALRGFRVADALTGIPAEGASPAATATLREAWAGLFPEVFAGGGFDAIVGNPPFHTPLQARFARDARKRDVLRARLGGTIRGQADIAVAFTVLGVKLLRPGGRAALLAPLSLLSTQDAAPARAAIAREARLTALWIARDAVFADASVRVCAPLLQAGSATRHRVRRYLDADFTEQTARTVSAEDLGGGEGWSLLAADLLGAPALQLRPAPTLGEQALVRADFRDVYYGLRSCVREASAEDLPAGAAPLLTTGLVDLAAQRWGRAPTRFHGRSWQAPVVDLEALASGPLARWAPLLRAPKVLLATQTRVLEAVVDEEGACIPCTPLISVIPRDPTRLWHVAAALASPPVTALAAARSVGAGMALGAIKLSVGQVRALPLPVDSSAWDEAAARFRAAQLAPAERAEHLRAWAEASCRAYGLAGEETRSLLAWWEERRVAIRPARSPKKRPPEA